MAIHPGQRRNQPPCPQLPKLMSPFGLPLRPGCGAGAPVPAERQASLTARYTGKQGAPYDSAGDGVVRGPGQQIEGAVSDRDPLASEERFKPPAFAAAWPGRFQPLCRAALLPVPP